MSKSFFTLNLTVIILLQSIQNLNAQICQAFSRQYQAKYLVGYTPSNYLKLPNTNILLINTILYKYDGVTNIQTQSIVYYNDISSEIDNIVNVVQPKYIIFQMEYVLQRNQILALNSQQLIYADPYTLEAKQTLPFSDLKGMHLMEGSNYCVLRSYTYLLYVVDFVEGKQILTLNNSPFNSDASNHITSAKLLQLQNGQNFIVVIDVTGAYTWSIDFKTLEFSFNGYYSTNYGNYRLIDFHQSYDIIFLAGEYCQIRAYQIINLQSNQIKRIQNNYLPNCPSGDEIISLTFINSKNNQGSLYLSTKKSIYRIDLNFVYNQKTNTYDSFSFANINQPFTIQPPGDLSYEWYHLEESQQFLTPYSYYRNIKSAVFVYSYSTSTQLTRFDFTKTFSFQLNQEIYFAVATYDQILVTKDSPSNLKSILAYPLFSSIKQRQNTFFSVKNCNTCFIAMHDTINLAFYKVMDSSFTPQVYKLSQLNLDFSSISFNIDPYQDINQAIWVIVGLTQKNHNENFLFYAINISSQQSFKLLSNKVEENNQNTSYALYSQEDQEIVGIAVNGSIFVWNSTDFSFKYSIASNCSGSIIGQLFHTDNNKFLIIVCGNYNLISYNFSNKIFKPLMKLKSNPYYLNVFNTINMFGVGDQNSGDVYLWSFNTVTQQFELFMHFQSPSLADVGNNIQYIEKTQVLFIQYQYSNTFFPIGQCLQNLPSCTQKCQMQFYFNTTETTDTKSIYGIGSFEQPYTTSLSIISTLLLVKQYFELINGFEILNVNILVSNQNQMVFYNELLTLQVFAQTNLTIQSWNNNNNQFAQINVNQLLQFSGLFMLNIDDILINFIISSSQQKCGVYFDGIISSATIDNISISSTDSTSDCFFIQINNSLLTIKNINLQSLDFSNTSTLITIDNSQQIVLQNILIDSCKLSENFSILTQESDVNVIIDTFIIQSNLCDINQTYYPQFSGQLFEAGEFNVANMTISNNQFCNLQIFSTVSTIQQKNKTFQFQNITMYNNSFYTTHNYLFFDAIYSINPLPQHTLNMSYLNFTDNSYFPSSQVQSDIYLGITQLVLTEQIFSVLITEVTVKNQQEIAFCSLSQSSLVSISNISCLNEKKFFDNLVNREYGGCLIFNEVKKINITNLQSSYIKAISNSILVIRNKAYRNSVINLSKVVITSSYFEQNQNSSQANPILITSTYTSNIIIRNSIFSQNRLNAILNTQTYSTSAIQAINPVGSIYLVNNQYINSVSSSIINFQYIVGQNITIINANCKQSSFNITDNVTTLIQQGGCLRAKSNNLQILSSNFSQSTASQGSFIYLESLSSETNIFIEKSSFIEGYAQNDGGAFYINSQNSNLNFVCKSSNFRELTNILGQTNSYFLNTQNSNVTLFNINNNNFNQTYPDYLNQITLLSDIQQVSFFQLQKSILSIVDCGFQNLIITNLQNTSPLLINAINTNSTFSTYLISVNQGSLTIEESQFININQISSKRVLQSQISLINSGALISLYQSKLQISQQTIFQKIICMLCFGSILQLNQTQFFISDSMFLESKANIGGAISINGLVSNLNYIQNTQMIGNTAISDGGAMFLKAQTDDVFTLTLSNCQITDNQSLNGSGGALFISSESESTVQQQIKIYKTNLSNNNAVIGGCINNLGINPVIDSQSIILNNQATLYGDNINSYPDHLGLIMTTNLNKYFNQSTNSLILSNIKSGAQIPDIIFQLKDQTAIPIFPLDADKIIIQAQFSTKTKNISNYYIRGNSAAFVDLKQKQFVFQGMQLIGIPNSQAIIEFKSDVIKILNKQTNQFESNYSYELEVYFRSCNYGEIQNIYNTYTECVVCEQDKYSLDKQQCYSCPSGAKCQNGIIYVNQGFWRKDESNPLVIECVNKPSNCIGNTYGNQVCLEGYIGPLCEECDIYGSYWGESYSKVGSYQCGQCKELSALLWKAILIVIWTLFSIRLAIKGDLEEQAINAFQVALKSHLLKNNQITSLKETKYQSKLNVKYDNQKDRKSRNGEKASVYIKVFINYLQIIGSIITFNIKLTTDIFDTSQYLGTPVRQQMNSAECILKDIQTDIPMIYLKLLFTLSVPIGYLMVFILSLILQRLFTNIKVRYYSICTAAIFIFILVQPDLVSQMIAILSCRVIGDSSYILYNITYECNTSQHQTYSSTLVAPCLLVFAFIIPIGLFYILYKNKNDLQNIQVYKKYGFLYREYKSQKYYWEFVKILEKILIIIILNFYSQDTNIKGVLIFLVITLYGIGSNVLQPYRLSGYNTVDFYQTNVCSISVLLCLFISNNPFSYYVITSIIIIITINAWFIISLVQKFQKQKFNPQLKAKIKRIFQEFLNLSEEKKYDLLLSGVKIQIGKNHKRLFKDQQINQTIKQNKQNDLATENQQKLNSESDYFRKNNMNSPNTVNTSKTNQSPIFIQFEDLNLVSNQKESQKDKDDNTNKLIKLKKKYLAIENQYKLSSEYDYIDKDNENNPNTVYSSQKNQSPLFQQFEDLNLVSNQKESQKDKEDNSNTLIKLKQKYLAIENQHKLNSEYDYIDKDNENNPNTVYSSQKNQSPLFQCNIYNRFEELNIEMDQKESQKDKEDNSNEQIKLNSVNQEDRQQFNLFY
ncbi:transmembrane protein, putative (macronuclear) [Tetrahymena thermophila SB210]|uniref:Transmembrane protein, putative n=1 Tax=Tetrahymena thermophila (strain SB210) TaxID=312017 RepID=Q23E64_TETTS|nr:transmembrane protein, putative [Tetrahymena thermophila SB210]EAR94889.2 transmembrane protein, putative [Tetrahymena thermophila SB210]|eukprot:XP_001015134.2 transmembrane protein, putative [Tetrahymena thermophila SB210]